MTEAVKSAAIIGALSGEAGSCPRLDLPAFLSRAAKREPLEAWLHVVLLDIVETATMRLLLADPSDERRDRPVSATLPDGTKPALWQGAGSIYPLGELAEHELALRLKAEWVGIPPGRRQASCTSAPLRRLTTQAPP
jgi:hypothetical protein